jgi:hypothetical protein
VSEDGLVIRSDPGVGILKGGWHEGGGGPGPPGDGEPVNVKFEDEKELALLVGEEREIVAIGTPGAVEEPGITWISQNENVATVAKVKDETIEEDGEQKVRGVAKLTIDAPGQFTIVATNQKGSDQNKKKDKSKNGKAFVARVKLEIVPVDGRTRVINPNNHFSEDIQFYTQRTLKTAQEQDNRLLALTQNWKRNGRLNSRKWLTKMRYKPIITQVSLL